MKTLVVGVGNPIRGDDGVGPVVAEKICEHIGEGYDFLPFTGSGLDLLGFLEGYSRVIVIDSIVNDNIRIGECCRLNISDILKDEDIDISSHNIGILGSFKIASMLNISIPSDIRFYGIGIKKVEDFNEGFCDIIEKRIPLIAESIIDEISKG